MLSTWARIESTSPSRVATRVDSGKSSRAVRWRRKDRNEGSFMSVSPAKGIVRSVPPYSLKRREATPTLAKRLLSARIGIVVQPTLPVFRLPSPGRSAFLRLSLPQKFRGLRMESPSEARSSVSYGQCFICREWSWDACDAFKGTTLCLPCYVDVLEVRQGRGLMGKEHSGGLGPDADEPRASTGKSPSPFRQLDLFPGS